MRDGRKDEEMMGVAKRKDEGVGERTRKRRRKDKEAGEKGQGSGGERTRKE